MAEAEVEAAEVEEDKCLQRMIKYFNKEKIVAEKTIEKLKNFEIDKKPEA